MPSSYARIPFSPADADRVVAFCMRHPLSDYDAGLVRRLITLMTSRPDGVLMFGNEREAGEPDVEPDLVAAVLDVPENAPGAATLELLGGRRPVARDLFRDRLLPEAIAFARAGVRGLLLAAVLPDVDDAEAALAAAGFLPGFETCQMLVRDAVAPPSRPLPSGWRWTPLDAPLAPALHAALTEMFRDAATTNIAPLDLFQRIALSGAIRPGWQVLLDGERVAGAVQLVMHEGSPRRLGELRTLGRAPGYRGRGVGELLLAEAMRRLVAEGAREVELATEVANDRALDLYRRFGFAIVSRLAWRRLALR